MRELPTPSYCFDSIAYIPVDGVKYPHAVMAFLNSDLLEWLFRQTSTNNHVSTAQLLGLPAVSMQPAMGRGTPANELKAVAADAQAMVASADAVTTLALTSRVQNALARTPAGVAAALVALNTLAHGLLGVITQQREMLERLALELEGVLPPGAMASLVRLWTPISGRTNTKAVEARRAVAVARRGARSQRALTFEDVAQIDEEQTKSSGSGCSVIAWVPSTTFRPPSSHFGSITPRSWRLRDAGTPSTGPSTTSFLTALRFLRMSESSSVARYDDVAREGRLTGRSCRDRRNLVACRHADHVDLVRAWPDTREP